MIRKQINLTEELAEQLAALSADTGISESEHLRRALDGYIGAATMPIGDDYDPAKDPIMEFVGAFEDDGPPDLAANHDHYAYGAPKKTERSA